MERPKWIKLPVHARSDPDGPFLAIFGADGYKLTAGMTSGEAQWLAALINGTADATPADPDAGLSEGARRLIAKIRERDATPISWRANLQFHADDVHSDRVGGREGGAA